MDRLVRLWLWLLVVSLAACAADEPVPEAASVPASAMVTPAPASNPMIGTANPASQHCIKLEGRLEILTDDAGNQYGACYFANGLFCEEWALYRTGKCVAPNRSVPKAPVADTPPQP